MNPLDEAKKFFEKANDLTQDLLQEAAKQLPDEVQKAFWKLRKASHFDPKNAGESTESLSPSGRYKLVVTLFSTGPGTWNYSQGTVYRLGSDEPLAVVQRNYARFPFLFVEGHPKGDFLVCGENYQGQTVIELTTGRRRDELPETANKGFGFCWAHYEWIPSMQALLVDGCFWACPYEYRFYDFSDPMAGWPQIGEVVNIDADDRKPELLPNGNIKVFQTAYRSDEEAENDDENQPEPLGEIAAYKVYRREGLNLIEVETWTSEKEFDRRQKNKEVEERWEKWFANFKSTDPLYIAMMDGIKDPVFSPEEHLGVGITHDRWCPDFTTQERRIRKRIHWRSDVKTGYTIDLEWGAETGPVKLVIFKAGQTFEDKFFMEHSTKAMQDALAYAKALVSS
jgi:hypothetical protein